MIEKFVEQIEEMAKSRVAKTKPSVLDEKGFVILDAIGRPFWYRMWGGEPWVCYWHPDNRWVSLRRVTQTDIWNTPAALPAEQAEIYHKLHEKNTPGL